VDKRSWLKAAAGLSFFMAACQTVISLFPSIAAYFQAPPSLLEDRWRLFLVGEGAALIPIVFGLYALSGAGIIRPLPLLRTVLVAAAALFLLRGLFIIITALKRFGVLEGEVLFLGTISHFVFLAAGLAYAVGTVLNWSALRPRTRPVRSAVL
jgi:hypothetical protein